MPAPTTTDALPVRRPGFAGLESRLQPIGAVGGVRFVDDGLATNVLPTTAALAAFAGERVALLVGGHDRGVDYATAGRRPSPRSPASCWCSRCRTTATASRRRSAASGAVEVRPAADLEPRWPTPSRGPVRGVVLLSPAAPSFGRFRDYRHRSEAFAAAMAACREPRT